MVVREDWVVGVNGLGLTGRTGATAAFLTVFRPNPIDAAVDVGVFAVVGAVVISSSDKAVVDSLRKRLRMPPKKLDFLVVGTGVVVVCVRTNFSAISAFVYVRAV